MTPRTPNSTLFPYTTLFRSVQRPGRARQGAGRPPGLRSTRAGGRSGRPRDGSQLPASSRRRSEEHTSELQSRGHLVCRLLLEKKKEIKRPEQLNTTTILKKQ